MCALTQHAADSENESYKPLPACGVMSGYSLLHCYGVNKHLTPIQVEEVFRETVGPDTDLRNLSISSLRRGLEALSLKTEAVRIENCRLRSLNPPCILYFRPGSGVGDIRWENGHYLTLVKFARDQAVIVDWTDWTSSPSRHLPISELEKEWSGEAVVYPGSLSGRNYWKWGFILTGALVIFLAVRRQRKHIVTMLVLLAAFGCQRSEEPSVGEPTLEFEAPVAVLGEVPAGKIISHEFRFRVRDRAVAISAIHTSCSCTTATTDLIGRTLNPGEEHVLPVRIRPQTESFSTTQTLKIETSPPSGAPLALAVQYRIESGPEPNTKQVVATASPGMIPEAVLHIVDRRHPDKPVVQLDRKKSTATDFRFESAETSTQIAQINKNRPEKVAVDTTIVRLRATKRWPVGEHDGILDLWFSDGTGKKVRTLIRVPSPFQPSLDRIFCGILKPGQQWSAVVKCRRVSLPSSVEVDVTASRTGTFVELTDDDIIRISGHAPDSAGRFSETITITVAKDDVAPQQIPVTGIVRQ